MREQEEMGGRGVSGGSWAEVRTWIVKEEERVMRETKKR